MPFYNEAATLRPALERLLKTDLPVRVQVILVDDGSTDGSLGTVDDLASDDRIIVIRKDRNEGKGSAVRAGLGVAGGHVASVLDADLEYDPADFEPLLRVILDGDATVAFGTRLFGGHTVFSFWYVIGNKVTSLWASFLFDTWLSDIYTCFKVAPLEVWRSLGLRCNGFALEAEATGKFLRRGHRIYEIPISYRARDRAAGKKLRWTDGFGALWTLLRVRLSRR